MIPASFPTFWKVLIWKNRLNKRSAAKKRTLCFSHYNYLNDSSNKKPWRRSRTFETFLRELFISRFSKKGAFFAGNFSPRKMNGFELRSFEYQPTNQPTDFRGQLNIFGILPLTSPSPGKSDGSRSNFPAKKFFCWVRARHLSAEKLLPSCFKASLTILSPNFAKSPKVSKTFLKFSRFFFNQTREPAELHLLNFMLRWSFIGFFG